MKPRPWGSWLDGHQDNSSRLYHVQALVIDGQALKGALFIVNNDLHELSSTLFVNFYLSSILIFLNMHLGKCLSCTDGALSHPVVSTVTINYALQAGPSETFSRASLVFKSSQSHKYPQQLLIGMTLIPPSAKSNQILPYRQCSPEEAVCPRVLAVPHGLQWARCHVSLLFINTGMSFCCLM